MEPLRSRFIRIKFVYYIGRVALAFRSSTTVMSRTKHRNFSYTSFYA
jgi:hypothetical protein